MLLLLLLMMMIMLLLLLLLIVVTSLMKYDGNMMPVQLRRLDLWLPNPLSPAVVVEAAPEAAPVAAAKKK